VADLVNGRVSQQGSAGTEAVSVYTGKHDCGNECNEGSEVTCAETKAYRNVKYNFVLSVKRKV